MYKSVVYSARYYLPRLLLSIWDFLVDLSVCFRDDRPYRIGYVLRVLITKIELSEMERDITALRGG